MDSEGRTSLAIALTLVLVATTIAGLAAADPHDEPDHGVNETTFPVLWSGDQDGNVSSGGEGDNETIAIRQLANGTDVPLNRPPSDVERWNDGEIDEFPSTNRSVSIRPMGADTTNERFLKDAHATIFAVQPSTHARLSSNENPLFVGSDGTVLGAIDYRIELPEDDTSGSRQVYWSVDTYDFEETRLLVDGDEVESAGGTHTARFSFEDLDEGDHSLTLEGNVSVRIEEHVRTEREVCEEEGNRTTCHTEVSHDYTYHDESVTVSDRIGVVRYDFQLSGRRAEFPNGDTAIALTADRPWLGHSLQGGNVTGVWRFYSARNTDWDTLVYSTENGTARGHSPLHPLQVNAFPLEMGASTSQRNATVVATDGARRSSPTLPENVSLDVANESYVGSETLITRVSGDPSTVRARGLVRGIDEEIEVSTLDEVQIRRSNLTLSVVNVTGDFTTVRVTLRDESDGDPINTADREGHVVLANQRVNTTGNGTASLTLDNPGAIVSGRYEPSDWWVDTPGYEGDSQTISLGGPSIDFIAALFRFSIPVGLFLLAVYLIDRITHWQIWPPWRGL